MRGLELNPNLLSVGASFVREDRTVPDYRIFSINDRHPGMYRVATGGVSVAVEVWSVPAAGLADILVKEPAVCASAKSNWPAGTRCLGCWRRRSLCTGQREISEFGGWRAYRAAAGSE
ncbi:MAG: hypothetical protein WDN28_28710 [Chthoniobacter sp.]